MDKPTYEATINFFEKLLKILHPFMPFITEELWHLIVERRENDCIIISDWPKATHFDNEIVRVFEGIRVHITTIRNIRKSQSISPKEKMELLAESNPQASEEKFDLIVMKLCNLKSITHRASKPVNCISFFSISTKFHILLSSIIDNKAEIQKLKKDLEYNKGFLQSVQKKLANDRFLQNAKPEVIEMEKKKQTDAESKIKSLEQQLADLKGK